MSIMTTGKIGLGVILDLNKISELTDSRDDRSANGLKIIIINIHSIIFPYYTYYISTQLKIFYSFDSTTIINYKGNR